MVVRLTWVIGGVRPGGFVDVSDARRKPDQAEREYDRAHRQGCRFAGETRLRRVHIGPARAGCGVIARLVARILGGRLLQV
jgi:hypothetical protein